MKTAGSVAIHSLKYFSREPSHFSIQNTLCTPPISSLRILKKYTQGRRRLTTSNNLTASPRTFFFFFGLDPGMWKFPGQGLNSSDNAGSSTTRLPGNSRNIVFLLLFLFFFSFGHPAAHEFPGQGSDPNICNRILNPLCHMRTPPGTFLTEFFKLQMHCGKAYDDY